MVFKLEEIRSLVKEQGLWNPHLSEVHGGLGLNLIEFGQLSEILGRSPYGHYCFNCNAPDIGNQELLANSANSYIKETYLKPLLEGAIRSCFAMTEPDFAGSNPVYMATNAVKDGSDYVINGNKWFTTAADGASFLIVMANTNPASSNKYGKASMLIVPTETEGFRIKRNISIMGEENDGYFSHSEVTFKNCRVPSKNLIGNAGEGFFVGPTTLGARQNTPLYAMDWNMRTCFRNDVSESSHKKY